MDAYNDGWVNTHRKDVAHRMKSALITRKKTDLFCFVVVAIIGAVFALILRLLKFEANAESLSSLLVSIFRFYCILI